MKIFSATKYNLKQITPKNPVRVTQKLFGDHGSGHDSHHPVENFFRERNVKKPWSTWDHVKSDQFSVDSMISKLREPVVKSDLSKSLLQSDQSVTKEELNNQYIDFLTKSFTNIISKRYPDYRSNYEEYKHLLPNMDKMNSYQREVEILDAYMQWSINSLRDKIDQASQPSGESALEQAKSRLEIFRNLIKEDSSDTSIMKNLRKKLKKILDSDVRYEEFKNLVTKNNENQELLESAVLQRISNSKGEGYSKLIPLQGQQTDLNNVNSSLNPNRRNIFSALYHDQVKLNTLAKNPDQIEQERTKYLAFYDLILDQHIRQVQGKLQKDDPFRYVKKEHRPREVYEDEDAKNMYWDYKMSLNNEFYKNFKLEMNKFIKSSRDKNVQATEDPHRPVNELWQDEHKFPHVADRLGWEHLAEHPLDKNFLFERIDSNPVYQWQPFVQTPPINPDPSLDLELDETIYEDKWSFEWTLLWRLLLLLLPLPILILSTQIYENNGFLSPELSSKFSFFTFPQKTHRRSQDTDHVEKLIYWGSDMWYWQHWVRKGLFYPIVISLGFCYWLTVRSIGAGKVCKMAFNRSKDVVFVWKPTNMFSKKLHVYELHYLEKEVPHIVSAWAHVGALHPLNEGIIRICDTRTRDNLLVRGDDIYWNHDVRAHFDENTNTYWKGLRHKDLERGIFINNSEYLTPEEKDLADETKNEIYASVLKYGPLMKNDYENNFKYQLEKRKNESKLKLLTNI